jgi:uncharacterized protein with HEPN domain
MTFEDFCCDPRTIDAVNRNLGVIGEATNRIPENIKNNTLIAIAPKISYNQLK